MVDGESFHGIFFVVGYQQLFVYNLLTSTTNPDETSFLLIFYICCRLLKEFFFDMRGYIGTHTYDPFLFLGTLFFLFLFRSLNNFLWSWFGIFNWFFNSLFFFYRLIFFCFYFFRLEKKFEINFTLGIFFFREIKAF